MTCFFRVTVFCERDQRWMTSDLKYFSELTDEIGHIVLQSESSAEVYAASSLFVFIHTVSEHWFFNCGTQNDMIYTL